MTLFETLNQGTILLYCVIFGFLSGIIFDIAGILFFLCKNNKVVRFFSDLFATIICFCIVFLITYKLNFGIFRVYILAIFLLFAFLERITLGKLVAKTYTWCYNVFVKFSRKITKYISKEKINGRKKEKKN